MMTIEEIKALEGKEFKEILYYNPLDNTYYHDDELQEMYKYCTSRQVSKIKKSIIKTIYSYTYKTGYTRQGIYTAYRINEAYIPEN
jgi:hypothetical protein